jgi:ribosome maturation factor RimP
VPTFFVGVEAGPPDDEAHESIDLGRLGIAGRRDGAMNGAKAEMRGPRAVDPELEAELQAIARAADLELAKVEVKGNVLRLILDRTEGDQGITLGDCEMVAKQVSGLLDVVDFGKNRYILEVSSPGLDRELYGPRDYARFQGRLARVTFADEAGRKQTVVGRLQGLDEEAGTVALEVAGQGELAVALDRIRKAKLEIEL